MVFTTTAGYTQDSGESQIRQHLDIPMVLSPIGAMHHMAVFLPYSSALLRILPGSAAPNQTSGHRLELCLIAKIKEP